jgi:hypothetical protein
MQESVPSMIKIANGAQSTAGSEGQGSRHDSVKRDDKTKIEEELANETQSERRNMQIEEGNTFRNEENNVFDEDKKNTTTLSKLPTILDRAATNQSNDSTVENVPKSDSYEEVLDTVGLNESTKVELDVKGQERIQEGKTESDSKTTDAQPVRDSEVENGITRISVETDKEKLAYGQHEQGDAKAEEAAQRFARIPKQLPLETLPNWRPPSLKWLPYVILLVIVTVIAYIVLYTQSKKHGIICTDYPGVDKVFLHGPALIGLLIGELLAHMTFDLDSILPYFQMSSASGNLNVHVFRTGILLAELPDVTLKDKLRHPYTWLTQVITRSVYVRKARITRFVSLFASIGLPTLLSATFWLGRRQTSAHSEDFRIVDIDKMISTMNGTMIPSVGMTTLLNSDITSDIYWLFGMELEDNLINPHWFGAMPFAPLNDEAIGKDESRVWEVPTDILYSHMDCVPLTVQVRVSQVQKNENDTVLTDLSLDLDDNHGCHLTSHWDTVSTAQPTSVENPILMNGSRPALTLWASSMEAKNNTKNLPENSTMSEPCAGFQHFIVSGPIQDDLGTGTNAGWAAIRCTTSYYLDRDVDIFQGKSEPLDIVPTQRYFLPLNTSDILNTIMVENFVGSGIVYSLSEPTFSRTFWRARVQNTFTKMLVGIQKNYKLDCAFVPGTDESWTSEQCKTYIIVASLWGFLTAGLPTITTPFLGPSGWTATQGSVTSYKVGWYVSGVALTFAVVLLLIPCIIPLLENRLHLSSYLRKKFRVQSQDRSGLYGTPSSITGLAFCFQDLTVRSLFTGIDVLENKKATEGILSRLSSHLLLLRRWQESEEESKSPEDTTSEPTAAIVKANSIRPAEDQPPQNKPQSEEARHLQELMYGEPPLILQWQLLLAIGILISAAIVVVSIFIMRTRSTVFSLWHQGANIKGTRMEFVTFIYRLLVSGLPILFLSILSSLWWANIDLFFRRTQPFASLKGGALGARSVGVQYVHDMLGIVSFKAAKNGHWWLAFVTIVTLLGKVAIFLSAGIFKMKDMVWDIEETISYRSVWRDKTFPADQVASKEFRKRFRRLFLSLLVFDYSALLGWKADNHQFPMLWLERPTYNVMLDGLRGTLTCHESIARLDHIADENSWTAKLEGGECDGATRYNLSSGASGNQDSLSAIAWTYLKRSSCSKLPGNETDRWWILSTASSDTISLLCKPGLSFNTINLTVEGYVADLDYVTPRISTTGVESELPLSPDHWQASGDIQALISRYGDDATAFLPFASAIINSSLSTTDLLPVSLSLSLDYLSTMLLVLSSNSTKALTSDPAISSPWALNASDLALLADRTFALAINTLVSL